MLYSLYMGKLFDYFKSPCVPLGNSKRVGFFGKSACLSFNTPSTVYVFHAQLPHVHTIPTLRLLTWNVRGGLRKKLSDPNFGCVLKQADVSVLTETRHISFKPHVPGYICYMSAPIGNKAGKRGAGGVCVFIADRIAHAVKSTV